jgi:long-chain acyl-CoA synthetase
MVIPKGRNDPDLFLEQADRSKIVWRFDIKIRGMASNSWREYSEKVTQVAAGLISLGLSRGECVTLLGTNRPEWLICHLAVMTAGGATCGIYPTSAPEQILYVIEHSGSRILFVENEEQVDKVLQILPQLKLKQLVVWDPKGLWGFSHPEIIFFNEFLEKAKAYLQENAECVTERRMAIDPEDTAMIIYTSGTTGRPKGAMISHANIMGMLESFMSAHPTYETDEVISYLPLAHIYENFVSLFQAVWSGGIVNFVEPRYPASEPQRGLPHGLCWRPKDVGEICFDDRDSNV